MKKAEQIKAFGVYLGKGLLLVCETTMTIKMLVRICFGSEAEVQVVVSTKGFWNKQDVFTPLKELQQGEH